MESGETGRREAGESKETWRMKKTEEHEEKKNTRKTKHGRRH